MPNTNRDDELRVTGDGFNPDDIGRLYEIHPLLRTSRTAVGMYVTPDDVLTSVVIANPPWTDTLERR